ncbi:cytochrome c [Paenibacillus sp. PAMC21692]|uniref:c-type cytochrome n=1 Tax=Paenibacillus sp. PAMC21692 TaxID=2762320 RepID=UPI00164DF46B|nr:cytochrome c [Paenibacillus sp. PAMC21692]QNK55676.1 cytochrome c [Paenibacillus sp. PAMC21692]
MHKWIMATLLGVAGLLAVYLLTFNLPEKEEHVAEEQFTVPDTPVDAATAEAFYKSNCMGCHGDQYQGAMGPALANIGSLRSKEEIYKTVLNGKGGGMPSFEDKITEDELINLTNWLAEMK